jgi:hypothetical protein
MLHMTGNDQVTPIEGLAMGVLTADERGQLIDLLLSMPNIEDPAARRLLTANLPRRLQENIPFSDTPTIHIANIVDAVNSDAWAYLADGSLAVATVITNATGMVEGSSLAAQLTGLLNNLKARPVLPVLPGGKSGNTPPPAPASAPPAHAAPAGPATANLMATVVQQGGPVLGWVGTVLGVIAIVASGDLTTALPVGFCLFTFWLLTTANRNPGYLRFFAAIICLIDLVIATGFVTYGQLSTFLVTLTALVFFAATILLTIKYTQNQQPS